MSEIINTVKKAILEDPPPPSEPPAFRLTGLYENEDNVEGALIRSNKLHKKPPHFDIIDKNPESGEIYGMGFDLTPQVAKELYVTMEAVLAAYKDEDTREEHQTFSKAWFKKKAAQTARWVATHKIVATIIGISLTALIIAGSTYWAL